jgi:hypothetical protein
VIEHAELHLVSSAVGETTVIPRSRFLPSATTQFTSMAADYEKLDLDPDEGT